MTKNKSKLDEVFSLFLSKETGRPVLHNPFLQKGKVIATDAFTAISVDEKECDFEFTNEYQEHAPDVERIFRPDNMDKLINILKSDFDKFKTVDETVTIGEDVECSTCNGQGDVDWEFEKWTKCFACPRCDGSGLEEKARERKTGNKTFWHCLVKMDDTYFDMAKFYKLIKVQEIIGGEIRMVYHGNETLSRVFKIGICSIVIMPTLSDSGIDKKEDVLIINY